MEMLSPADITRSAICMAEAEGKARAIFGQVETRFPCTIRAVASNLQGSLQEVHATHHWDTAFCNQSEAMLSAAAGVEHQMRGFDILRNVLMAEKYDTPRGKSLAQEIGQDATFDQYVSNAIRRGNLVIRNTTLSADALWPPLIHALVELAREYRAKVTRREDDDLAMLISALQLRDERGQL